MTLVHISLWFYTWTIPFFFSFYQSVSEPDITTLSDLFISFFIINTSTNSSLLYRCIYRFLKYKTNCATALHAQRASIKQESANWISFVLFATPISAKNHETVKQIAAIKCNRFFLKNKSFASCVAVLTKGISPSLS